MSVFEVQQAMEEQRLQEVQAQGEMAQPCEGSLENMMTEGASEGTGAYQDRIARLEQRNAERKQAAEERTLRQNEISFGSRAVENAEKNLEERAKLERQVKQKEEFLESHQRQLNKSGDSNFWTQKWANEIKRDAQEIKKLEKQISELK